MFVFARNMRVFPHNSVTFLRRSSISTENWRSCVFLRRMGGLCGPFLERYILKSNPRPSISRPTLCRLGYRSRCRSSSLNIWVVMSALVRLVNLNIFQLLGTRICSLFVFATITVPQTHAKTPMWWAYWRHIRLHKKDVDRFKCNMSSFLFLLTQVRIFMD